MQAYVATAKSLPVTDDDFENALGAGARIDMSDYRDLQACYRAVKQHCGTWDVNVLLSIVGSVKTGVFRVRRLPRGPGYVRRAPAGAPRS